MQLSGFLAKNAVIPEDEPDVSTRDRLGYGLMDDFIVGFRIGLFSGGYPGWAISSNACVPSNHAHRVEASRGFHHRATARPGLLAEPQRTGPIQRGLSR